MIVEFRIPLPIQVSDFEIAQLFMITKLQENVTGGGEGVIILKNEPFYFGMSVNPRFDNTDGHMGISPVSGITVPKAKGQYTLKHYLLASMFPSVVKAVLPKDALYLVEEAWNCHPYCMTVMTNGYFAKDRFRVTVESRYVDEDVDMTWMSDI
jgi:singapore isolate B (sub-type 7) whole genome shotgun sequence assembly, scaffold_6